MLIVNFKGANMLKQYVQLSRPIDIALVVGAMKRGEKKLSIENLAGEVVDVDISSLRMQTYTKGTSCVTCGKEGHFFILERMRHDKSKGHFNLYHVQKGGSLRMMTSDHIIAKSRGGSDTELDNRQPMCCHCNFRKSNRLPGEANPAKKEKKEECPSRTRTSLKYFLDLTNKVSKGLPLDKFWEIRAKTLARLLRNIQHLSKEEQDSLKGALS